MKEVIPVELFPFLSCLEQIDKEAIEASQGNHGPTRANSVLVDRLKRRQKGFQDFVQALRKCGFEHTALILDPYYNYPVDTEDDETADTAGSVIGFKMIGTAIDVTIKGNLVPQNSEEQPEDCSELETYLAKKFKDHSSAESKKMRKELQKHLPQGAVFVNTAKGSIVATFRLSSEQAAKKLWEMYSEGKFQTMLQTVLVENTLKEDEKIPDKPLELNLSLVEDHFNQIQRKLAEIESKQEVEDSLLSTLTSKQEDSTGDDGSVHEMEIDIPPVYLGSNANSFILELREYQKELAAPAIEGKNTIICAPTNSGKTYVAIDIAKKHLDAGIGEAGGDTKKEPRVVFIVSTVNLVLQQKERFKNFLGDKYPVGTISGANSTEIPLKYLLKNHKVVVMTAQILVNALNSKSEKERVQLSDISLLLFDECHHADKEHSYNRIMERYLALKKQAGKQHRLPQVVGFTASLGTGKAQSVEKAEKHILLVSANLDAAVISTVKKNEEELKKYANVPKREIFHAPNTSQDPFVKIVSQVMDKIEALIKRVRGESYKVGPTDKAGQQYRQWVEQLYKGSIEEGDRFLVTYAEQLREYHVALTINASTTMKNAKKRLQRYFVSLNEKKFLPIDKKLKNIFEHAMEILEKIVEEQGEPVNPLLMHLKELLLKNYKDVKPQQEEDSNSETSKNDGANEASQKENGTEEKNLENKEDAMTVNREKSSGNESGNKSNGESTDDATNGQVMVEEDVTCDGDANETAGDTDEVEKGKAEVNGEHKKEPDRGEENASLTADNAQEDKPSDNRNEGKKEWKGPKGILFTRTRESTEALLDWIKETKELNAVLRPEKLVGSGDGNIGMTQNDQERVINRFHTGEKNLLLATSVAEEGLDIRDCNYVIRYDMMGNEISTVQSRGRVRADEGKYSVLVGQASGALKREHTSWFRESLMIEALSNVQSMDPRSFTQQVKAIQQKNFQERYYKKHLTATRKSVHLPGDVTFHCRKCNVEACQAHDIRTIKESHFVVINSDFRDFKVHTKKLSNPRTIDDIVFNKKIFCKQCHEDWGVTALINGVEWMCIKIRSFVLEFPGPNPQRRTFKKWKDLPFGIKEASSDELLQQATDGAQDDFDFDLNLDV
ncbi:hypothetical protein ACROYT_G003856 [Oculina patagonica]